MNLSSMMATIEPSYDRTDDSVQRRRVLNNETYLATHVLGPRGTEPEAVVPRTQVVAELRVWFDRYCADRRARGIPPDGQP